MKKNCNIGIYASCSVMHEKCFTSNLCCDTSSYSPVSSVFEAKHALCYVSPSLADARQWRSQGGVRGVRTHLPIILEFRFYKHTDKYQGLGLNIIPFHYPPVQGGVPPYGVKETLVVNGRA